MQELLNLINKQLDNPSLQEEINCKFGYFVKYYKYFIEIKYPFLISSVEGKSISINDLLIETNFLELYGLTQKDIYIREFIKSVNKIDYLTNLLTNVSE